MKKDKLVEISGGKLIVAQVAQVSAASAAIIEALSVSRVSSAPAVPDGSQITTVARQGLHTT